MILLYHLHLYDNNRECHATLKLDWETDPADAKNSMEEISALYKKKGFDVVVEKFSWDNDSGVYTKVVG